MSAARRRQSFPLRLSTDVHKQAAEYARREGVSLNQFISYALAEKISRVEQETYQQYEMEKTKGSPSAKAVGFSRVSPGKK